MGPRACLERCGKSRPPTGIRSPDRLARNQSLYRLSYRAHHRRKDCGENIDTVTRNIIIHSPHFNQQFPDPSLHFPLIIVLSWAGIAQSV